MYDMFPQRLKELLTQLELPNAQLARALNLDPALISRWLKSGCGKRRAAEHALAIGNYVMHKRLTPENQAWLRSALEREPTVEAVALWLNPKISLTVAPSEKQFPKPLVLEGFRSAVLEDVPSPNPPPEKYGVLSVCDGMEQVCALLQAELSSTLEGTVIEIYLSSESSTAAIAPKLLTVLRAMAESRQLKLHMLVQSSNNSAMSSRLLSAYMPLLVCGKLEFSVVQGTPQTFTVNMNIVIPERIAIVVTETAQKHVAAVAAVIRELSVLRDMHESFVSSTRFARPMMTAYDDSFARSIIEVFFEEYGVHGGLDVIKCGMNPMYMTVEGYGKVLNKFGH